MASYSIPVARDLAAHLLVRRIGRSRACDDDDVQGGKLRLRCAKRLPDQSLDPVPSYRGPGGLAGDRKTQARVGETVAAGEDREQPIGGADRLREHVRELPCLEQSPLAAEASATRYIRSRRLQER